MNGFQILLQLYTSAPNVKTSLLTKLTLRVETSKPLVITQLKGIGEGDIVVNIEFQGKVTQICLTQVMHFPGAKGRILSLKLLTKRALRVIYQMVMFES